MSRLLLAVAAVLAACGAVALLPASAQALLPGEYSLHRACWNEASDPHSTSEGWSAIGDWPALRADGCVLSDPLVVRFGGTEPVPAGAAVGWTYEAPADSRIGVFNLRLTTRLGSAARSTTAQPNLRVYREERVADEQHLLLDCVSAGGASCGTEPRFGGWAAMADAVRVHVVLECVGAPGTFCAAGDGTELAMGGSSAQLMDALPPQGAFTGGSALAGGPVRGVQTLTFNANDRGLGVRHARILVGDAVLSDWAVVSAHGERCAPVSDDGVIERWLFPVPCPLAIANVVRTVDLSGLPDGTHAVTLELRDAAGNLATTDTRSIEIGVPRAAPAPTPKDLTTAPSDQLLGLPDGRGPASRPVDPSGVRFAAPVASTRTVRRGQRFTLEGRLVDAGGAPLAGARVVVRARLRMRGAPEAIATAVTTSADGRFSLPYQADGSRDYVLAFVGPSGALLATKTLTVAVPARITFAPPRSTMRRLRATRFTGRIVGPLAGAGTPVRIEARFARSWRKVATVNADAAGRFSWTHRFHHVGGFRMRATVAATELLAAAPASSRPARFHVR